MPDPAHPPAPGTLRALEAANAARNAAHLAYLRHPTAANHAAWREANVALTTAWNRRAQAAYHARVDELQVP